MTTTTSAAGSSSSKGRVIVTRRFACRLSDLEPGSSMTVPGDPPIALFRTESDELFATGDSCTHELWSLGEEGDLDGAEVVCPLHMARYDLRTGKALCLPATIGLPVYEVDIDDDGSVYVSTSSQPTPE